MAALTTVQGTNDVTMDEGKIFDACALVEEIMRMTDVQAIRIKAQAAADLLNMAMEEGEKR